MLISGLQNEALARTLAGELAEVDARFAAELGSDLPCVNDLVMHLERYRGKMLRPHLVLLCGLAVGPDQPLTEEHRTLAAVVEMVHMATLVHDDVLDEAAVRRKGQTINRLRGNEAAVMLGDYLISHAYHLCSRLANQTGSLLIAQSTNTLCEGELLQLANRNNLSLDERTYFEIIRRKTAALCGVSCRLGALYAGGDKEICDGMDRFGEKLGIAFQIIDDVLDLTGDQEVVGKSLGKDLEKRKLTLPLIHRLETSEALERQKLLDLLRTPAEDQAAKVGRMLMESDSVNYARKRAEQAVAEAQTILNGLPDSPARGMLRAMAQAVLTREY